MSEEQHEKHMLDLSPLLKVYRDTVDPKIGGMATFPVTDGEDVMILALIHPKMFKALKMLFKEDPRTDPSLFDDQGN
jgi:hypothetical protein